MPCTCRRRHTRAIHQEDAQGKTCIDCHINIVHQPVPEQATFKREAWHRLVEERFELEPGTADRVYVETGGTITTERALAGENTGGGT